MYDTLYQVNMRKKHGDPYDQLRQYGVKTIPKVERAKLLTRLQADEWTEPEEDPTTVPPSPKPNTPTRRRQRTSPLTTPGRSKCLKSTRKATISIGEWQDKQDSGLLFQDNLDWDMEATRPVKSRVLVKREQACSLCVKNGRRCWMNPDGPDSKGDHCAAKALLCRPQSQAD
jgi:hypothetical protein